MPTSLSRQLSHAASSEYERVVPRPLRSVLDRALVDSACVTRRGIASVAEELRVDVPAVDEWRRRGVPTEFRRQLASMVVHPRPIRRQPCRPAA